MFFGVPDRTQFDWNFRLLGYPVRVHPMFWFVTLIMGARQSDPVNVLIWIGVVFISILVHEFGHALAFRRFGRRSQVLLYGMGGLCIPEEPSGWSYSGRDDNPWNHIFVCYAGPLAGFLLAGVVVGGVFLWAALRGNDRPIEFHFDLQNFIYWRFSKDLWDAVGDHGITFLHDMIFVNIFWGLVNLLPIYPLDGGQISRELFCLYSTGDGVRESLILSIVAAIAVAAWGAYGRDFYIAVMFGLLAFSSYQMLAAQSGRGYGGY